MVLMKTFDNVDVSCLGLGWSDLDSLVMVDNLVLSYFIWPFLDCCPKYTILTLLSRVVSLASSPGIWL
jgi:hypothetical protein